MPGVYVGNPFVKDLEMSSMQNRSAKILVAAVAGGCAASCASASLDAPGAPATPPPDIIVIFVDDLGYADLSCQGSTEILTPNIDRIAANGIRFTDGYVTAPQCSPSRAGIMTGRYNQRFGYEANAGPDNQEIFGLPPDQRTMGDVMRANGYQTAIVGEWDLGRRPDTSPLVRGFDYFYGFYGASRPFFPGSDNPNHILWDNDQIAEVETSGADYYLTDLLTDKALDYMETAGDDPYFMYLAYHAPHWPLQATPDRLARMAHIEERNRRAYAAIMLALDENVGRILDHLEETGKSDNTMVFFISDNGGPTGVVEPDGSLAFGRTTSKNDPLRGVKGQLLEGGIRIPYLVQWPGTIPAGQTVQAPVISIDVLPTIAAAGGGMPQGWMTDGENILPMMTGNAPWDHDRHLYFRWMGQRAVRAGDWKYVKLTDQEPELYYLPDDIGEANNLVSTEPEKLAELEAAWFEWNALNHMPKWRTPQQIEIMRRNYINGMEPYVPAP